MSSEPSRQACSWPWERKQQVLVSQNTESRIHELLHLLDTTDLSVKEYRDDVVRSFIDKVVFLSAERIRVTFKDNAEIEVQLPCE